MDCGKPSIEMNELITARPHEYMEERMQRDEEEVPAGLWGDAESERPETIVDKMDKRMLKLPGNRRNFVYILLAIVVVVVFVACVVLGSVLAAGRSDDEGKEMLKEIGLSTGERETYAAVAGRFTDLDYLDFLSEESLQKFVAEFSSLLERSGYETNAVVKIWSTIERDGSQYVFYASTSSDGQFYRIVFDAENKTFSFDKSEPPADIPELQNGAAGSSGNEEKPKKDEADGDEDAPSAVEAAPPVEPAPASVTCGIDDASQLSTFLPQVAVSYLPGALVDFLGSKGCTVSADDCVVNLSSATVANSKPYFEASCIDSAGGTTVVACEWNTDTKQFGFSIISQ